MQWTQHLPKFHHQFTITLNVAEFDVDIGSIVELLLACWSPNPSAELPQGSHLQLLCFGLHSQVVSNDQLCVWWGVKPYSLTHSNHKPTLVTLRMVSGVTSQQHPQSASRQLLAGLSVWNSLPDNLWDSAVACNSSAHSLETFLSLLHNSSDKCRFGNKSISQGGFLGIWTNLHSCSQQKKASKTPVGRARDGSQVCWPQNY